jgi:hypothetical protein
MDIECRILGIRNGLLRWHNMKQVCRVIRVPKVERASFHCGSDLIVARFQLCCSHLVKTLNRGELLGAGGKPRRTDPCFRFRTPLVATSFHRINRLIYNRTISITMALIKQPSSASESTNANTRNGTESSYQTRRWSARSRL